MPNLDFKVLGVEPADRGVVPLIQFKVEITNQPPTETIQNVILQAQIQIQAPQRSYNDKEKEKLNDLFGTPDRWGQTLRTRLWTLASTTVRQFTGRTEAIFSVPCSFDLNVAGTKYFYALEEGEVPLLFLFSGTVFYTADDGRLQIQQISWNKESAYRMPLNAWRELMNYHYPNSAWITLDRAMFDRLQEFKRREGLTSWERVIERLLAENESRTR
jgi:hypothetical protein